MHSNRLRIVARSLPFIYCQEAAHFQSIAGLRRVMKSHEHRCARRRLLRAFSEGSNSGSIVRAMGWRDRYPIHMAREPRRRKIQFNFRIRQAFIRTNSMRSHYVQTDELFPIASHSFK